MTPAQIIAEARRRMGDRTGPYLVDGDDHMRALAEAEDEAAMRASLLYDNDSAFLTLALVPGEHRLPLDTRIWRIEAAKVRVEAATRATDLPLTGIDALDERRECMRSAGRPQLAAHMANTLRVWPTPSTAGVIELAVYRRPLCPVCQLTDALEIAPEHHMGLVDWLLYRAYMVKDSEVFDPAAAARALQDFTDSFGERPDADTHRQHNERRRHTTRYGGL